MDILNRKKINQLLISWPKGTVAVYPFLKNLGISPQLAAVYQKGGWIKSIGSGAFVRSDDKIVNWTGGLYALQQHNKLNVHIGGKTALEYFGYAHFVNVSSITSVNLYGDKKLRLPAWFKKNIWGENVHIFHYPTNLFASVEGYALSEKEIDYCSLVLSAPERAIMEVLYLVPQQASFNEARLLFEGLNTLRPEVVQKLLENCNSVKVKRLFMFLAELCKHEWVNKLNLKAVNFGKGKRVLVKNGIFNKKYGITIPKECGAG